MGRPVGLVVSAMAVRSVAAPVPRHQSKMINVVVHVVRQRPDHQRLDDRADPGLGELANQGVQVGGTGEDQELAETRSPRRPSRGLGSG